MDYNESVYLVLRVVNNNSNINLLVNEGMTYAQIAEVTNQVIQTGYLLYKDNVIELTDTGKNKLQELEIEYKRVNKEEWIRPDKKSRIPKINRNDIFLPNQDELKFL